MNFIRNWKKTNDECVPVAIFNACNIFGANLVRERDLPNLKRLVAYKKPHGWGALSVNWRPVVESIFECGVKVNPTLEDLDASLEVGQPVLINVLFEEDGNVWGHVAIITGKTKNYYKTINYSGDKTEQRVSKSQVAKDLKPKLYRGLYKVASIAYSLRGVKK